MKMGMLLDVDRPLPAVIEQAEGLQNAGVSSAWASQIFGHDALTLLALVGRSVPGIGLGTGVVPVYPRHPQMMAQQALTVQQAVEGRLSLGIGLSHQMVVEHLWGLSYAHPARYMEEYLSVLMPMLHGETVAQHGTMVTAVTTGPLQVAVETPPPVLVAALGTVMLRLAGRKADGTVTWMTGTRTVAEHIVPTITAAASDAGRPRPRVVVSLPVVVTDQLQRVLDGIDEALALYPSLPSYRAMLEREGATKPSDIALVGSEAEVRHAIGSLESAGATELVASVTGSTEERAATIALLAACAEPGV